MSNENDKTEVLKRAAACMCSLDVHMQKVQDMNKRHQRQR
jgi:hypothetical protein